MNTFQDIISSYSDALIFICDFFTLLITTSPIEKTIQVGILLW